MNKKSCSFFGLKEIADESVLLKRLFELIETVIEERGVERFLFCGLQNFNAIANNVIGVFKKKYSHIIMALVKESYIPELDEIKYRRYSFDEIIIADLARVDKRQCDIECKKKVVEMSDFCIFYVENTRGSAYKVMQYAKELNKDYINIADLMHHEGLRAKEDI